MRPTYNRGPVKDSTRVSKFQRSAAGRATTYVCEACGKRTRETGDCESGVGLCAACYRDGGLENEHQDGARQACARQASPSSWKGVRASVGLAGFASERQARHYARECTRDGVAGLAVLPALELELTKREWYAAAARAVGPASRSWKWVVVRSSANEADYAPAPRA